jgi:hypothetical protein
VALHESTYQYLKPSTDQVAQMAVLREATKTYSEAIEASMPEGPDKTYVLRKIRECGMWANVAVTRMSDGTPRPGAETS